MLGTLLKVKVGNILKLLKVARFFSVTKLANRSPDQVMRLHQFNGNQAYLKLTLTDKSEINVVLLIYLSNVYILEAKDNWEFVCSKFSFG